MARKPIRVVVSGLRAGSQELGTEASRYVARVHRLRAGARFLAIDPERGIEAEATVERVSGGRVLCAIAEPSAELAPAQPPSAELAKDSADATLLFSLSKGEKVERVLSGATELGVGRIVLVAAERSVVRLTLERAETRRARWLKVLREAARQSLRVATPELLGPLSLAEALGPDAGGGLAAAWSDGARTEVESSCQLRLLLHPAAERSIDELCRRPYRAFSALIGPEGGFTAQEIEQAARAGYVPARFGGSVLRSETAALAVLGALLHPLRVSQADAAVACSRPDSR